MNACCAKATDDFRYERSLRLTKGSQFEAVRAARAVKQAGPLRVGAKPNGLDHCRLGMAVSRRVGNAVVRNRIRRLIRESFRLLQHDLPAGYDLVVIARPHEPAALDDYQRWLTDAAQRLDRHWQKKGGAA